MGRKLRIILEQLKVNNELRDCIELIACEQL